MNAVERLLETNLEQGRKRLATKGRHTGKPVPQVPAQELRKMFLIRKGSRSSIYHGKSPVITEDFVIKEFFDLEGKIEEYPDLIRFIARDILRAEDAVARTNKNIIYPLGYSYTPKGLSLLLERGDKNFLEYADELWGRFARQQLASTSDWEDPNSYCLRMIQSVPTNFKADQKSVGKHLLSTLLAAAEGLDLLHKTGYTHRDVATSNLILNLAHDNLHVTKTRWGDTSEFLGVDDEDDNLTHGMFGTFGYVPGEVWFGTVREKDLPPHFRDIYGFGRIISRVAFREQFDTKSELGLELSEIKEKYLRQLKAREEFRASKDLEIKAAMLGLPGLERVMICATDVKNGYESMGDMLNDLREIAEGRSKRVIKSKRRAWAARGTEEPKKSLGNKICGALAVVATLGIGYFTYPAQAIFAKIAYEREYPKSVEAAARVASSDLKGIGAFIDAQAEKIKQDMRKHYLRQFRSNPEKVFPYGSFHLDETFTKPVYFGSHNSMSEPFMEMLRTEAVLTDDVQFMKWYAKYAEKLEISYDEKNENEYTDLRVPAIGRYASVMRHLPVTIERFRSRLAPEEVRTLETLYEESLDAASIALRQYHAQSRTFQGIKPVKYPVRLDVDQESMIIPLITAIVESKDVDRVLDPAAYYAGKKDLKPVQEFMRSNFKPMSLAEVYKIIGENGTRAGALVRHDGKSFWRATIDERGNVLKRQVVFDEIGENSDENGQAVVSQDHAREILAMSYRLDALSTLPLNEPRLRRELGDEYPAFVVQLEQDVRNIAQYKALLRNYIGNNLPNEYAYLPPGVKARNAVDATAAALIAFNDARSGNYAVTRKILKDIPMSRVPRSLYDLHKDTPGLLLASRGYMPTLYGDVVEANAYLLKAVAEMKN